MYVYHLCVTFDDVVELRGGSEVRQKESIRLNEAPHKGDTSAPELGVDLVDLALIPLFLLSQWNRAEWNGKLLPFFSLVPNAQCYLKRRTKLARNLEAQTPSGLQISQENRLKNPNFTRKMGETDWQKDGNQATNQFKDDRRIKAKLNILIADFLLSAMWAWTGHFIKIIVHRILGLGKNQIAEVITYAFKVMSMFLFAKLGSISKGGSHNPLSILPGAISADFNRIMLTVGARIPAQVVGSIVGVKLLIATFSDVGRGPKLNVEIHHGALIEGVLAFIVAIIAMGLTQNLSGSFYRKNWISSISKISLQILTSDLTGACTNPASAIGWAFARGDHLTTEHLIVYWLAPLEATVLAVWVFKWRSRAGKDKEIEKKTKSE
ncbi:hypothetical protein V2J09_024027 [Rumex salicifolius]